MIIEITLASIDLHPHRYVTVPLNGFESNISCCDWRSQGIVRNCVRVLISNEHLARNVREANNYLKIRLRETTYICSHLCLESNFFTDKYSEFVIWVYLRCTISWFLVNMKCIPVITILQFVLGHPLVEPIPSLSRDSSHAGVSTKIHLKPLVQIICAS